MSIDDLAEGARLIEEGSEFEKVFDSTGDVGSAMDWYSSAIKAAVIFKGLDKVRAALNYRAASKAARAVYYVLSDAEWLDRARAAELEYVLLSW